MTLAEWAKILSEVSGKNVSPPGIPVDVFLDGTEIKKTAPEEMYLNYLGFYKG